MYEDLGASRAPGGLFSYIDHAIALDYDLYGL